MRVLLLGLAACVGVKHQTIGPFVSDVSVEGYALVVTRCEINRIGDGLGVGECTVSKVPLPVTMANVPATLDAAAIAAGIDPMRGRVAECLVHANVTATLHVWVTIDHRGRVSAVEPAQPGVDLVDCIGQVLGTVAFPPSLGGARADVPFEPH